MYITKQISTGKVIEMQSAGTEDVMRANAANYGFLPADIEWLEVTEEQYLALKAAEPDTEAIRKKKVDCHCSEMLSAGFVYGGATYQIDGDAQEAIGKRAIYADWSVQDPATFPWVEPYSLGWWDVLNVWHGMTAAEFRLFAKAVSDYVSDCAARCRNHKNAITPLNCATYDYTTGWPVNP